MEFEEAEGNDAVAFGDVLVVVVVVVDDAVVDKGVELEVVVFNVEELVEVVAELATAVSVVVTDAVVAISLSFAPFGTIFSLLTGIAFASG